MDQREIAVAENHICRSTTASPMPRHLLNEVSDLLLLVELGIHQLVGRRVADDRHRFQLGLLVRILVADVELGLGELQLPEAANVVRRGSRPRWNCRRPMPQLNLYSFASRSSPSGS